MLSRQGREYPSQVTYFYGPFDPTKFVIYKQFTIGKFEHMSLIFSNLAYEDGDHKMKYRNCTPSQERVIFEYADHLRSDSLYRVKNITSENVVEMIKRNVKEDFIVYL
jgi:hypothetical protein